MERPLLLDLFCGAGGAAAGYQRAGFDVVGVDIEPQPNFPFDFVQEEALAYVRSNAERFDVIHASPPCQAYVGLRKITIARYGACPTEHPDLIAATRDALVATGKIYIIENVTGSPLHTQFVLCGKSMGLPNLVRHRHFESNFMFTNVPRCSHMRVDTPTIGVYGSRPDGRRVSYRQHKLNRVASSLEEARRVMGIDWMEWDEIKEAVPPVYTEWIGTQLMHHLELHGNARAGVVCVPE